MSVNSIQILAAPFERDMLTLGAGRILFLNASSPDETTLAGFSNQMDFVQPDRAIHLQLSQNSSSVSPVIGDKSDYVAALIIIGKHRALNRANIALAAKRVIKGGMIVVAGEKTSGIASLKKEISSKLAIVDSLSKYHGLCFWFANPGDQQTELFEGFDAPFDRIEISENRMATTRTGMFSHKKVDKGSALLVEHIDEQLKGKIAGKVADFGAGWGYLGMEVLRLCPQITGLSSFEADHGSLEACKINLPGINEEVRLEYFWQDLKSEPVSRQFDWVIMNPPFHDGRSSNLDLGHAFIQRASEALRPHGKALLVANAHLAYEKILERCFPRFEIVDQQQGFKIIKAFR